MPQGCTADEIMAVLCARLMEGGARVGRRVRVGIALAEGHRYLVDTGSVCPAVPGWSSETDLTILCNEATLRAIAAGTFDPAAVAPEQMFVAGGDVDALRTLLPAVSEGQSWLAMRSSVARQRR